MRLQTSFVSSMSRAVSLRKDVRRLLGGGQASLYLVLHIIACSFQAAYTTSRSDLLLVPREVGIIINLEGTGRIELLTRRITT